ncbi:MAG: nitroreductase family protein, partial [Tissierellia bacterium]|nr:nitroreductase family protein [Tissierellia bacterium]
LTLQFIHDFRMYYKHSSVFKMDTYGKIESEITLRYHSIEKGFLHKITRPRFAKKRVKELIDLLKQIELNNYSKRVHIQSALLSLCRYYDFHLNEAVDISDYFKREDYDIFKSLLELNVKPIKYHTDKSFFEYRNSDFSIFSKSRASVRDFTGVKISNELLEKVVELANHAPSVCNRQPVNVHLVENKSYIDKILEIQDGLKGYSSKLSQVLVITCDRNYFYSIGERHQLYTDGGIYIMNLLYSLHFYGIGACPAHWGMPYQADVKVMKLLNLKDSEQIISLVAIGVPTSEFSTTLSLRRSSNENLIIHS